MDGYSMPTRWSSGCSLEVARTDWADDIAKRIIGVGRDGEDDALLKRDIAAALRAERDACADAAVSWLGLSRAWRHDLADAIRNRK